MRILNLEVSAGIPSLTIHFLASLVKGFEDGLCVRRHRSPIISVNGEVDNFEWSINCQLDFGKIIRYIQMYLPSLALLMISLPRRYA